MEFYTAEPFGRTVTAIIGYSIRPIIIVMFFDIIEYKQRKRWMWLLVVLNTLIHLTTFFSNICFAIYSPSATGYIVRLLILYEKLQVAIAIWKSLRCNKMNDNRPSRRKCKDNPYTLSEENGRHVVKFRDSHSEMVTLEIEEPLFDLLDTFEREDLRYLNQYDRHEEHSELPRVHWNAECVR